LTDEYVLEVRDISKYFPGVLALNKMQLHLKKGEVMALVGENGAGKSTLMKILSGVYQPDEGEIFIEGHKVNFNNPAEAAKMGISIVYQELSLFPQANIAENIFVNNLPRTKKGLIDYNALHANTQKILDNFSLKDIKPQTLMRNLSIDRQQVIEIIRATTSENQKILILDEPTSALTSSETELLFSIIRDLKKKGTAIIYISHRLDEIFEICDTVTVIRDGIFIKKMKLKETTKEEIVKSMVGRDVAYNYGRNTSQKGEVLLSVKNLQCYHHFKNISFDLYSGEVLGIAGLEGAGRTELLESIFGVRPVQYGEIFIQGRKVKIKNPESAKKSSIAYITKDRKKAGLFTRLSIERNILSGNLDIFSKRGIVNHRESAKNAQDYVMKFDIKTHSLKKIVNDLSGGNQQKVLLSMWFTRNPRIILIDEPTRGIDVGTKESIHQLIRGMAKKGSGIIIVSSDMPELLGSCDRIIVMYEGTITGELSGILINEDNIMRLSLNEKM
jgi:inositol transport system ATP-binding protein